MLEISVEVEAFVSLRLRPPGKAPPAPPPVAALVIPPITLAPPELAFRLTEELLLGELRETGDVGGAPVSSARVSVHHLRNSLN